MSGKSRDHVNIMIDIETLGTSHKAPIAVIAAATFVPDEGTIQHQYLDHILIEDYNNYKNAFEVDYKTLVWWMKQEETARDEAFTGQSKVKDAICNFHTWLKRQNKVIKPWAHGKEFDLPILEHAFKGFGLQVPWTYVNMRDTRTLYDIAGIRLNAFHEENTKHHAMADCIAQVNALKAAFDKLK